jgi:hypothetical protein
VALAADPKGPGALLAWAALDNQKPQLFATLLDANGKRSTQRMLTRAAGEVSEIAATSVPGGYVVAWVDERHGDPEVYVVRLDGNLRPVGGERRLTDSPGMASDLSLLPAGDSVLLAFSDARRNADSGFGDVYVVALASKDAAPLGPARVLHEALGHAHSIRLADYAASGSAARAGTAVVAWIETEGPLTDPQTSAVVRVGALDADGRFVEPPSSVRLGPGAPSGLSVTCAERRCLVVAGGSDGGQSRLVGFVWERGRAVEPQPLTSLRGPPGQNIAMDTAGDVLFFTDQRAANVTRVHALTLKWR